MGPRPSWIESSESWRSGARVTPGTPSGGSSAAATEAAADRQQTGHHIPNPLAPYGARDLMVE